MKIEANSGCTNFDTYIDGKEASELTLQELREAALTVIDDVDLQEAQRIYIEVIRDAVESFGEMEDLGYCEQCGDYSSKSTLIIE